MVADYLTQTVMGWDVGVETRRRATKAVLDVARAMQEMFDKLVEPHLPASPCGDAQPEDYWEEDAAGDAVRAGVVTAFLCGCSSTHTRLLGMCQASTAPLAHMSHELSMACGAPGLTVFCCTDGASVWC
jgi:hypothetical protein